MSDSSRLLLIASSKMHRTAAFERAVALARATGRGLHIVALDYMRLLEVLGQFDQELLATLRDSYLQTHCRWLEQEAEYERKRGLDCTVQVIWSDHVYEEIRDCIRTTRPAMLIKDVHHEASLRRLFSTPLDWHLIRECQCPVQLVTANHHPLPRKILAAVNLYRTKDADLRLNDEILRAATRLGTQSEATVHVLYSYDWSAIYAAGITMLGTMPIETGFQEALADAHEESFTLLCDRHGIDSRHRHFLTGTPLAMIDGFARQNDFDLLVLGTLPRNDLTRVLGNTAQSLLSHAPCSVLIVKNTVPAAVD